MLFIAGLQVPEKPFNELVGRVIGSPKQIALTAVNVGVTFGVTDNVPLEEILAQLGIPVVNTSTVYVPAVVVVKLARFPGLITPFGTVHT